MTFFYDKGYNFYDIRELNAGKQWACNRGQNAKLKIVFFYELKFIKTRVIGNPYGKLEFL